MSWGGTCTPGVNTVRRSVSIRAEVPLDMNVTVTVPSSSSTNRWVVRP